MGFDGASRAVAEALTTGSLEELWQQARQESRSPVVDGNASFYLPLAAAFGDANLDKNPQRFAECADRFLDALEADALARLVATCPDHKVVFDGRRALAKAATHASRDAGAKAKRRNLRNRK